MSPLKKELIRSSPTCELARAHPYPDSHPMLKKLVSGVCKLEGESKYSDRNKFSENNEFEELQMSTENKRKIGDLKRKPIKEMDTKELLMEVVVELRALREVAEFGEARDYSDRGGDDGVGEFSW